MEWFEYDVMSRGSWATFSDFRGGVDWHRSVKQNAAFRKTLDRRKDGENRKPNQKIRPTICLGAFVSARCQNSPLQKARKIWVFALRQVVILQQLKLGRGSHPTHPSCSEWCKKIKIFFFVIFLHLNFASWRCRGGLSSLRRRAKAQELSSSSLAWRPSLPQRNWACYCTSFS